MLLLTAGCASSPAQAEGDEPAPVEVSALVIDPDAFDLDLALPAVLRQEGVAIQPLTGASLDKASLSFDEVREALTVPDYLTEAEADDENEADEEPPAAAVRAYTLGRLAYHDGNRREAIEKLEEARQLDEDSSHILRVLGRMYFSFGNEVRGARRLREAVRQSGDDVESLFLLGRFAAQNGRWEEAIVTLARCGELAQDDLDPAVAYLRPFYLGQALLELGYDAAAVEQMREYLTLPDRFSRVTRLHREVAFLDRQRGRTQVRIGDALARLGRLEEALEHYEQATGAEHVESHPLTARRIYLLMAMGHEGSAQSLLIQQLRAGSGSRQTLELASYVAEHSPDPAALSARLEEVYVENDRPGRLALAMADLMEPTAARELLAEHLSHRPEDVFVLERLLENTPEDNARTVALVVSLIDDAPDEADVYANALLESGIESERVLTGIDNLDEEAQASAAAWYLRGSAHEAAGRIERALDAYDEAVRVDETFASPHLANVELQIRLERYEQALEMLNAVEQTDTPELRLARAKVYAGLDRTADAIDVLDELILQESEEAEPRLLLAELQAEQNDYDAAQRTLWAILDFEPDNERAYELLFEVHDQNPAADGSERLRLLRQVQQEIPESRIARLRLVTNWHLPRREFEEAERLLEELIEEDRRDYEALSRLVGLLGHTDRWDEAQQMLEQHIEQVDVEDPEQGVIPLLLLEEVVKHTGETDMFYERMEAFLDRQEPSAEVYLQLARLYDAEHLNQPEKGVEVIRKAIELEPEGIGELRLYLVQLLQQLDRREEALEQLDLAIDDMPDQAAELYCFKAQIYHEQDEVERAEENLQAALDVDPDHARANNDLAYYWAEQDRHLERAMEMARVAVDAEPDNGAYLDTLGWIYYKLGQFEEAAERLQEARQTPLGEDPVILDHLGDALWRLGETDAAVRQWRAAEREASRRIDALGARGDIYGIRDSAQEKIDAADEDEEPAVSPLPDREQADSDEAAEPPEPPDPADGD